MNNQWQPIETAPSETPALLWTPKEMIYDGSTIANNPDLCLDDMRVAKPRDWTWATYWMPLPDPPQL